MVENDNEFVAWIGIDWADKKHAWAMRVRGETRIQAGEMDHTPEAIETFFAGMAVRFPGGRIAVALEQSRGALIFMLNKYEHLVLFPIHPNTLDHYRKSFYPSGSKSDPGDAALILEVLYKHPERLHRFPPDTVETRTLQFLVEARRDAVDDRTRYVNRLIAQLKLFYPQLLNWFDRVDSIVVGEFLLKWSTLEHLQKARPKTVARFLKDHRVGEPRIAEIQAEIEKAVPAIRDQAVLDAGQLIVRRLVGQLAALREAIAEHEDRIHQLTQAHPSYPIFAPLPGAGEAMLPRLIAAFGTDRSRYANASEIQRYSGIAPVTEASGKQKWVHWRWACPKFLRQTFQEWAWFTTRKSEWARVHYDAQRGRGKSHQAAVRSLAFKWLRVIFRCWKDGSAYDEARYLKGLKKGPGTVAPVQIHLKKVAGFTKIAGLTT
jgi:transposase